MNFQSTRDEKKEKYSAAQVIKQGLADDGGLFVPESIPTLSKDEILAICKDSYPTAAAKILSKFLSDYTYEELLSDCEGAYAESSFPGGAAPIKKVNENTYSLELWHGPTAAFKDMALQIMPRLLSRALVKTGEERTALILVATSGDTGKAALEGYRDVERVKIMVYYPENGVSRVQKLQMATQTGSNVNVCAIRGNFDDAQTGVKRIFSDKAAAERLDSMGHFLSSANSINWGRLAPQIVYYVKSYCDLIEKGEIAYGETVNVCVPTGNFGNIFAAYIAKLMGLPLGKLICASNSNNILTDFLRTGTYDRNRNFYLTMSPSMDILISSNLERLLYFVAGSEKTTAYMKQLSESGCYTVDECTKSKIDESFCGFYTNEEQTAEIISRYFNDAGYLMDTHTAVAFNAIEQYRKETGDNTKALVASTASPYKFAKDVYVSLFGEEPADELSALDELSKRTGTDIPYPLKDLGKREINFKTVIDAEKMLDEVYNYLK